MDKRTNGAVVYENNETAVPGIFACGNVLQVHDLVDFVTDESIRAGAAAAEYVLQGECPEGEILELQNGQNVGYTVPMKLRKNHIEKGFEVSFRVKKMFGPNAYIVVRQGEKQIARFSRSYMSSSEMEKIKLPYVLVKDLNATDGPIVVSALEEEAK